MPEPTQDELKAAFAEKLAAAVAEGGCPKCGCMAGVSVSGTHRQCHHCGNQYEFKEKDNG